MPAVSLLFEHLTSSDKQETVLVVGAIDLAPFGQSQVDEAKGTPRPIVVLCERSASIWINSQATKSAANIVGLNTTGSVIGSSSDGAIFAFSPHLNRHRKAKNNIVRIFRGRMRRRMREQSCVLTFAFAARLSSLKRKAKH